MMTDESSALLEEQEEESGNDASFLDAITNLLGSVLLIAVFTQIFQAMPIPSTDPIVNIFIYKGDRGGKDYYTVMNGFEVSMSELRRNILLAKEKVTIVEGKERRSIYAIQVIAGVDGDVPSRYSNKVDEVVKRLNYVNGKRSRYFRASWEDYDLSKEKIREGRNEAKRKERTNT